MREGAVKIGRMLVGAESFADAEAALRLAAVLGAGGSSDMGGLLVLDAAFQAAPGWPGQRIVTSSGLLLMSPSHEKMRALVESEARAFRGRLEDVARACAVAFSFEVQSGNLIRSIAQSANTWDVLLLGHRNLHRRVGPVVYLAAGLADASDTMAVAALLAGGLNTDTVALVAATGASDPDDGLIARIDRLNASAIVLDASEGAVRSLQDLGLLLDRARCPVVVLHAAQLASVQARSADAPLASGQERE